MRPPKKLSKDYKPLEQPPQTYPFGKNGVRKANTDAAQNEPGFAVSSSVIPYEVNGVIETDLFPIIMSTNNVNSAIGFYDDVQDVYTPIVNDVSLPYKLGFRKDKYIKGEARRNYLNNIEIAWLDKLNPLRFMDTANPPLTLSNYLLFPEYIPPTIDIEITKGGTLELGAYFAAARYINEDGTQTRYTTLSTPVFATAINFAAIPGTSTAKSLKINLSDLDANYNRVQIVVVRRTKGITTAVELDPVPVVGNTSILYTGTEGNPITMEEVLIPGAYYNNAGSITQLNDVLYLADMEEAQTLNLQKYATLVKLRWKADFRFDIENDEDVRSGRVRTFKHGEAYAFFIKYYRTNGTSTDAFHTPGPAPLADHLLPDVKVTGAKKFQTDTLGMQGLNSLYKTGGTGVWINATETYPTSEFFNATDIGGEDLRGKAVRHHKMPTLNQTKALLVSPPVGGTNSERLGAVLEGVAAGFGFGVNGLDALGIQANNVIIPPDLQGVISGYEILYAKRDYANTTMVSQGFVRLGAKSGYTGNDIHFTGGNFNSRFIESEYNGGGLDGNREFFLNGGIFKISHPDLMVNRPAIVPSFLAVHYRLRASVGSSSHVTDTVDELNLYTDYYKNGSIAQSIYSVRPIKDTGYLLNNSTKGVIKNTKSEEGFVGTMLPGEEFSQPVDFSVHGGRASNGNSNGNTRFIKFEEGYIADVASLKSDLYKSFMVQDLARTGVINSIDGDITNEFSFNGDCFLVVHSYVSHGLVDSVDRNHSNPGQTDGMDANDETDSYTDEFYYGTSGTKVARRYVTESIMNLWQRYQDLAIKESKFWPATDAKLLLDGMDRNKDNNVTAIGKDASSIGDLLNGVKTYDFNQVNILSSPYKVVRSSKQQKEGKRNSWKNFNALDYYEADKNMGRIMNLQGYDGRLIIHHRNALYLTEDRTTLQGDILSVTLGSGDIFRFPPKKGKESKQGYGGTQHQLACTLTDYGYIFPDAETGIWFVLNEEGLREINNDFYNFFREYLTIPEINPFVGNGICVGYDNLHKRVLVTVKNKALPTLENYVPNYQETPEFYAQLIPNQSIVYKNGRYLLFKGVNTSAFSCTVYPPPVIGDYTFLIDEFKSEGVFVGQVQGTGISALQYVIIGGNTDNAFSIDSITGKIYVANRSALNTTLRPGFTLTVKVTDNRGATDTGLVNINMIAIILSPFAPNYEITVNENVPVNTNLQLVGGIDPRNLPLTYSITSQTTAGAVKINAVTGQLQVNTQGSFNYEINNLMFIDVLVSNGTHIATSRTKIVILNLNEAPLLPNKTVNVINNIPANTTVMTYDVPTDPDFGNVLTATIIAQSVPGAFTVNFTTRQVKLAPGTVLDSTVIPQYTITIRTIDNHPTDPKFVDTVLTMNIINCTISLGLFTVVEQTPTTANVTANSIGGVAPFTYVWSNGQTSQTATGLSKTTSYTITVTDSIGCSVTTSLTPNSAVLEGLNIEVMYFELGTGVTTDPYYDAAAPSGRYASSGHTCNAAKFNLLANGIVQGVANMNNNDGVAPNEDSYNMPPGAYNNSNVDDRYYKKVISKADATAIANPDGTLIITMVYIGTIDWGTAGTADGGAPDPHSSAVWIRIKKQNGTTVVSSTLSSFTGYTYNPYA